MNKLKMLKLAGVVATQAKTAELSTLDSAKAFVRMVLSTASRKYKPRTRNLFIGSLVIAYVLSPIDLIPGIILDDAAIVLIALKYFSREIDRYLAWEKEQKEKSWIGYTKAVIVDE